MLGPDPPLLVASQGELQIVHHAITPDIARNLVAVQAVGKERVVVFRTSGGGRVLHHHESTRILTHRTVTRAIATVAICILFVHKLLMQQEQAGDVSMGIADVMHRQGRIRLLA